MSKIIQALEKAKQDGALSEVVGTVDERDTLASAPAETPRPEARVHERHRGGGLMQTQTLDPEVLRGVDPHLDALHKPLSVVAEQYRAVRSRLERLNYDAKIQTIAITSALKGEGKSLTAANLAAVMAQDPTKRILLVDADLRRPKLHKLLALDPEPGLAEYLQGEVSLEAVLRNTPFFGLTVVTAGAVRGHPSEMLASHEFNDLVGAVRSGFDYILFDTPPLHPISDVNFLSEAMDGVLIVARAGKTGKGALKQAVESLPPDKVIGTLLNRANNVSGGGRYGYGKGYYYYKYY